MRWLSRLGVRSNEQAVANARAATTLVSRRCVERDEVALYLRSRYADLPAQTFPGLPDAAGAEGAR